MEYVYAVMLLHKAGKPIDEASVKKVLDSAGIKVDEARVKALVSSLEGVDIDKVVKEAVTIKAAAPIVEAKAKEEKKKPEKKEEEKPSEEEAAAGLSALFG